MAVTLLRERYRVDLQGLQAVCAANYVRLLRLLPDMRAQAQGRRVALSHGDALLGVLNLHVLENCPYTSTLRVSQDSGLPGLPMPSLEVRVYHDACMAEVVASGSLRRLRSRYGYPNEAMHQPDEKAQLNVFLGEWLAHCLACGHELQAVR